MTTADQTQEFVFVDERHREYLENVKRQAGALGILEKLEKHLSRLQNYANGPGQALHRCVLYPDSPPLSFGFNIEVYGASGEWRHWFNGGLIFHGRHDNGGDGGAPTFAVSLTPINDDWAIHT